MIKVKYIVNNFQWEKYVHDKKNEEGINLSKTTTLIHLKNYFFFWSIILAKWILQKKEKNFPFKEFFMGSRVIDFLVRVCVVETQCIDHHLFVNLEPYLPVKLT